MEISLAWTLPPLACTLLFQALSRLRSPLSHAVATYICFSVVFGCAHFLVYRHDPAAYIVSKDVPIPAAAKGVVDIQQPLEDDLKAVAILDALLLQMSQLHDKSIEPLQFDEQTRHYPQRYPPFDIDTSVRARMVGPSRDQPVYSAVARITLISDYRGLKRHTTAQYSVAFPNDGRLVLHEAQFASAVLDIRRDFAKHIEGLFGPGSMTPRLFSLWDFFYFSFSIVGVGEVIPRDTPLRLLVLLQILLTFVIPIALQRVQAREG